MIIGDNELIGLYLGSGDVDALNQLVNRHSRLVYGVCRKMLWRAEDAEDAFQIVFLLLCKKAPKLLEHNSLAGWLHKTSVLTCLKLRRKIQRTREINMGPEPVEDKSSREPWRTIASASDVETLHCEIQRLPTLYREVVVLCHLEGKSRAQAAALLDCTTASVKAALARGRKQLRQRLLKKGIAATVALAASKPAEAVEPADAVTEFAEVECVKNEHSMHSLQPLIAATLLKCQGLSALQTVGTGTEIVNAFIQKELSTMSFVTTKTSLLVSVTSILIGGFCLAAIAATPNSQPEPDQDIVTVFPQYTNGVVASFRIEGSAVEPKQEQEGDEVDPAAKTKDETWDEYTSRLYDIKIINEDHLAKWRDGETVVVAGKEVSLIEYIFETRTRMVPVTRMRQVDDGKGGTRNVPETVEVQQNYTVQIPQTRMAKTQLIIPAWDSQPEDATNPGFQVVKAITEKSKAYEVSKDGKQRMAAKKPSQSDATYDAIDPETVVIRGATTQKGEACVVAEDSDGETLRVFVDSDKDSKIDRWMYYADGKLSIVDKDTNGDGKTDRVEQFITDNPELVRVGVDTDQDGKIDEWSEEDRTVFEEMYDEAG